jgi:TonB family protein
MAKKEKFGKFVLLEELEATGLGAEYRAAKLGQSGLEKIVSVLRLNAAVSGNAEVAKSLMDQAKIAAQLQNPNVVKIYGIGKVDASYYISYEFIEGKSLKAIFNRCRSDGFPFSVDHTLLIASKLCSALEYAHGRKNDTGTRYFHGLVTPASILVSYEGEVRVRGFGYWPGRLRDVGLAPEDSMYLAPEQAAGGGGDTRSDTFAVGAILYETLTGHALFEAGRADDIAARLAQARLQSPTGDDDALPKPIADILSRSLAKEPAGRYGEIQEMRKAIDTLLFSGDFTPTTFNLAFFMHSLFREDIERESKALKEERETSYLDFIAGDDTAKSGSFPVPVPPPPPVPAPPPKASATVVQASPALPLVPPPPRPELKPAPVAQEPAHADAHHPPSSHADAGLSAKEAAAGFTFHKEEPKSKGPLFAGIAVVVVLLAVGGYFVLGRGGSSAPPGTQTAAPVPATLSPEAIEARAKVKELEAKLKQIEDDKTAAEQKAKDDAAAKMKKEAQAKGQTTVDETVLQKAQEDAAKKVRIEQEKKAQEEKKRLEEEKATAEAKAADEARKAEETRRATEEAAAAAASAPPSTSAPAATKAGALVNLSDIGVIAPMVDRTPPLQYPPIALRQRVEGTVELNVLVDEKGNVTDAQVVTSAGGKAGLNEAAIDNVKKRKYRPASRDGVPVKVWIPVRVKFELPK